MLGELFIKNMEKTLKQKVISAVTGASMLLGGLVVSDVAVETPAEKLDSYLVEYDLQVEDVLPFTKTEIETSLAKKDFTPDEKELVKAMLEARQIFVYTDNSLSVYELQDEFVGIGNKLDLKFEDLSQQDFYKQVREKLR